jgi:hypothetical protein
MPETITVEMINNFFNWLDSRIWVYICSYLHHSWGPFNWFFLGLFNYFQSVNIKVLWYFINEILYSCNLFKLVFFIFIHFEVLKNTEFLIILNIHSYILAIEFLFYILDSEIVFFTFYCGEVCQRIFIYNIFLILK